MPPSQHDKMPSRGEIYSAKQADVASGARRRTDPRPAQLSEAALKFADENVDTAISTVVVSGIARVVEFALIALTGLVIQLVYVYPNEGFPLIYPVAILLGSALSVMGFQAIDIYSPHALRTIVQQQARHMATFVRGQREGYEGFRVSW